MHVYLINHVSAETLTTGWMTPSLMSIGNNISQKRTIFDIYVFIYRYSTVDVHDSSQIAKPR
jgi:hypothetical protein